MSSNITDMADKNATAAQTISLSFDNVRLVNDSSPSFCLIHNPQMGSQVACEIKICQVQFVFNTRMIKSIITGIMPAIRLGCLMDETRDRVRRQVWGA